MTRITGKLRSAGSTAILALCLLTAPAITFAQTDPNAETNADTTRLKAETDRINAEAARINAEAARDQARITALRLPSFDGTTTLNAGAGAVEATILASHTVMLAAEMIKQRVDASDPGRLTANDPIIILAGDENLDFGRVGAINSEMDAIYTEFERLRQLDLDAHNGNPPQTSLAQSGGSATAVIGAISAAAGLLRSNTEVTALDLQSISNRVLATAVAAKLGGRAILPSAAVGALPRVLPPQDWDHATTMQKLNLLVGLRTVVQAARDRIPVADPSKPTQAEKDKIAPYTNALTRFDAFATRVTTADANGAVPIVQAARLESLLTNRPRILRVYVDKAGGSLIRSTNILTTLALDSPVRVTGGMIATFTLTEPGTGGVLAADIITCRTALRNLREVQQGVWPRMDNRTIQQPRCEAALPVPPRP